MLSLITPACNRTLNLPALHGRFVMDVLRGLRERNVSVLAGMCGLTGLPLLAIRVVGGYVSYAWEERGGGCSTSSRWWPVELRPPKLR